MHYSLIHRIVIGKWEIPRVHFVRTECSWKNLGDTAVVLLPLLSGRTAEHESLAGYFNKGDKVSISLGYGHPDGDTLYDEFTGYVKHIKPNVPLEIECEDNVYLLRQVNLKKAFGSTTLAEVVAYILDEVNAVNGSSLTVSDRVPEINFKKFRLNNVNAATALQKMKEEYGLAAYFRGDVLFVGLPYLDIVGDVRYGTDVNVVSADLTKEDGSEKAIKVKAVAIQADNTRLEAEVGDPDGEQRTLYFYNVTSKTELQQLAEVEADALRVDMTEGSLTGFLIPQAGHSMTCYVTDAPTDLSKSRFMVDEVKTTFGASGARRVVTIGKSL